MTPPWKKATQMQKSIRQEERLARLPGGKKQVNSGRTWFSKRDNQLTRFLVEARYTDTNTYSITRTEFEDITKHAFGTPPGQLPAMQIDFARPTDTLSVWVMRLEDQVEQQQYILALEAQVKELRRGA